MKVITTLVLSLVIHGLCNPVDNKGEHMAPFIDPGTSENVPNEYVVHVSRDDWSPTRVNLINDSLTRWVTDRLGDIECTFKVRDKVTLERDVFLLVEACEKALPEIRRHPEVMQVETNWMCELTETDCSKRPFTGCDNTIMTGLLCLYKMMNCYVCNHWINCYLGGLKAMVGLKN